MLMGSGWGWSWRLAGQILLVWALIALCAYCTHADARIARSAHAKTEFRQAHPCPATGATRGRCPGYVIDHVVPLCAGGADSPANMAWQQQDEAKVKDRQERAQCRR